VLESSDVMMPLDVVVPHIRLLTILTFFLLHPSYESLAAAT
jgi:hypothetical protein